MCTIACAPTDWHGGFDVAAIGINKKPGITELNNMWVI